MKRVNPVRSLLGLGLTILLFVGLGISLWFDRGLAFSPGHVTDKSQAGVILEGYSSHADFEKQCGKCHDPLRTNLATKCLECHNDVKIQIQTGQGAHRQISTINQCASCHPEHRGRNFDPTLASFQLFDHSNSSFSLIWHQENYDATPMECSECHASPDFSVVGIQTCQECHAKHDEQFMRDHIQNYGNDCTGCHDGTDRMQDFDHRQTGFALEGNHAQISCNECHDTNDMKNLAAECESCHIQPSMHTGMFAQKCDDCHTAQGWSPALLDAKPFGHFETAGFSLARHQADYSGQAITCNICHPRDFQTFELQTCMDCHGQHDAIFMTGHVNQYDSECMTCHDGVDRLSNFQHANFFPLEGVHATTTCADCHTDRVFRGTPSECSQCHTEPEIHVGIFGARCYYCHTAETWSPASLRMHIFPLNHGLKDENLQSQCDACHETNYIEYTCTNCHDHQQEMLIGNHQTAGIPEQELPACARCHPDGSLHSGQ
jgi:hypothetical protein